MARAAARTSSRVSIAARIAKLCDARDNGVMESPEAVEPRKRLDAFVDAAFGFAVTLLVIAAAQPPENLGELKTALLRIPASAAAFAIIASFWAGHRTFGRYSARIDKPVVLLSLLIVFTTLVYVYPLRLLTQAGFFWVSGGRLPGEGLIHSWDDLQALYVIYGLGFAILAGLYAGLFALGRRSVRRAGDAAQLTSHAWAWGIVAGSGLVSTGLALVIPLRVAPWLPPMLYSFIPLFIWGREWISGRRTKAQPLPPPPARKPKARPAGSAPSRRR